MFVINASIPKISPVAFLPQKLNVNVVAAFNVGKSAITIESEAPSNSKL